MYLNFDSWPINGFGLQAFANRITDLLTLWPYGCFYYEPMISWMAVGSLYWYFCVSIQIVRLLEPIVILRANFHYSIYQRTTSSNLSHQRLLNRKTFVEKIREQNYAVFAKTPIIKVKECLHLFVPGLQWLYCRLLKHENQINSWFYPFSISIILS